MRDTSSMTQSKTAAEQEPKVIEELNNLFSISLPSLREIKFYGPHSKAIYGCVLIERLIKERFHMPESLRALHVKSDCWPNLTDDYNTGERDLPVYIECMKIDGPDETYLMPIPMMVANTLVELRLDNVVLEYFWKLFVPEGAVDYLKPVLSFSSLRKLSLSLIDIDEELPRRKEDTHNACFCRHLGSDKPVYCKECLKQMRYEGPIEASDEESEDSESYVDAVQDQLDSQFSHMPGDGTPCFPVLTSLELYYSIVGSDLEIFADSPISSLVLRCQNFNELSGQSLSIFDHLRSLSIPILYTTSNYENARLIRILPTVLSTVGLELQHLSLSMTIGKDLQLQFAALPFAGSLTSLTLEGEYGQYDVEHML
ncbi:hypothetical protein GGI17_003258 [Coemansia sp. S146]|nr:hypothetical protein GGI17_003258 [Coemansia sp. S146]